MNRLILVSAALLISVFSFQFSVFAQVLIATRSNDWLRISISDSTNNYALERRTNTAGAFLPVGLTISNGQPVVVQMTNVIAFYRAIRLTNALGGFLIYANTIPGGGNEGGCVGSYVGQALYTTANIGWYTNGAAICRVTDPAGSDNTRIVATSLYGAFNCGASPLSLSERDEGPFVFNVYFKTNVPPGQYPLRIEGFIEE